MTDWVFTPPAQAALTIAGQAARFPIHRVYCVGQNYAEHSREMGGDPAREAPFFFSKPADAIVESGGTVHYPSRTRNLHHEIELVVALGKGGANVAVADALSLVFGYAVGNDLTRRDLQAESKKAGRPWDTAKGFDEAGVVTAIQPLAMLGQHPTRGRIWLTVNGEQRQNGDLSQMIWKVPEIIAELSTFYRLQPGDLIYTGTPAGVGPLERGAQVAGAIDGVATLSHRVA